MVKTEKLWKEAGSKDFAEWLTSEGFSRSWGYRCSQIYDRFQSRAENILPDRLTALLPLKMDADKEAEMLEAARTLPAGAFVDHVREARGTIPSDVDGCEHEFQSRCIKCGRQG